MKKIMLCLGFVFYLMSCAPSDKIEGIYEGKFYENGDSTQGSVKIVPVDGGTVGILLSSSYGNLAGGGVNVIENGDGFDLYKNGYTPYTNTIIYISGSIAGNEIQFEYNSSNSTQGSFKGAR